MRPAAGPAPRTLTDRLAEGRGTLGFAIIGEQKASTTSIQNGLHAHPAVALSLGEIGCFESPDYERGRVVKQPGFTSAAGGPWPASSARTSSPARRPSIA